jgi:hypothetical protein
MATDLLCKDSKWDFTTAVHIYQMKDEEEAGNAGSVHDCEQ